MAKLNVGDKVKVMIGKDSGKTGEIKKIVDVVASNGKRKTRVIVEGVNKVKRARKPNPTFGIIGGMEEFEKPIDISNVMYLEGSTPTRIGYKIDEKTNKKVRYSKKSGKIIK